SIRVTAPCQILRLVIDGLISIKRGRILNDERLPVAAAGLPSLDFRAMKQSQIAKRIAIREKRREQLHRRAGLIVFDQGSCPQVLKRRVPFRWLFEQLGQIAPSAGNLQSPKLIGPLLHGPERDGERSRSEEHTS